MIGDSNDQRRRAALAQLFEEYFVDRCDRDAGNEIVGGLTNLAFLPDEPAGDEVMRVRACSPANLLFLPDEPAGDEVMRVRACSPANLLFLPDEPAGDEVMRVRAGEPANLLFLPDEPAGDGVMACHVGASFRIGCSETAVHKTPVNPVNPVHLVFLCAGE